tara:strand:+ start:244 stop:1032 length:789 start_codon:yes stop_codon:yes gene_type:complete
MPAAVNGMKECTKCGETKDVSEYGKSKKRSDGLDPSCKDCRKQYYQDNREEILAKRKQYYPKIREDKLSYNKQYYQDNREEIKKQKREYYQDNKEWILPRDKIYRQNDEVKEARRKSHKIWQKENKEHMRKYRQDNKEKISEQGKKWYQKNKESVSDRCSTRHRDAPAAVYEIENKITGKIYIGQSVNWKKRWIYHKHKLSHGKHKNLAIQSDYDEHGLDSFEHRVFVEYPCDTSSDVLREHERQALLNRIREGREVYNVIV